MTWLAVAGKHVGTASSVGGGARWKGQVEWATASGMQNWGRGGRLPLFAVATWARGGHGGHVLGRVCVGGGGLRIWPKSKARMGTHR
jgi:hypothetical protein